ERILADEEAVLRRVQAQDAVLRELLPFLSAIGRTPDAVIGETRAGPIRLAVIALREAEHRALHREHVRERLAAVLREQHVAALRVELTNEDAARIFR